MAAKSSGTNQGLVIGLIIFVMLTFILAVSNYFAYSWLVEAEASRAKANKDKSDSDTKARTAILGRKDIVKVVLGLQFDNLNLDSEDVDEIIRQNEEILKRKKDQIDDLYGEQMEKDKLEPTYANAVEWLAKAIVNHQEQLAAAQREAAQFEKQKVDLKSEKDAELELNAKAKEAAETQLAKEMEDRSTSEQEANEKLKELIDKKKEADDKVLLAKAVSDEIAKGKDLLSMDRRRRWPADAGGDDQEKEEAAEGGRDGRRVTLLLEEMKEKDRTIVGLNKVVAQLRVADAGLQKTVMAATPVDDLIDGFDGRILSVNELDRTVLVSVGTTTGIRPGLIFNVYDPAEPRPQMGDSKGAVEVLAIEGGSLVRARVRRDATRDPILPGDAVATSLWAPGASLEVVLVGSPQFGGDAAVDADRFRRIVERIGGTVETAVSPATTMVVDAGIPKLKGIDPDRQTLRKPMSEKDKENRRRQIAEANRLGIKVVAIEPFLDMLGLQLDAVGANRLPVPADQRAAPARNENLAY